MNGIGLPEIMGILLVALIIFGPRKLPELGKNLGAGLREFKRSTQNLKDEFEGALQESSTESVVTRPDSTTVIETKKEPVAVHQMTASQPKKE